MLRRFESIKDCGIFEDFRWNTVLPDFERINLIYGPNGSGKTSLSRALDSLNAEAGRYANVSIAVSKADGSDSVTSRQSHIDEFDRLFVFSDRYVKDSHDFDGDTEVEAVLTLGKKTVEDEKRIGVLKGLVETARENLTTATTEANTSAKALDDEYTAIARGVVTALSRAGGEYASNSNYHQGVVKRKFKDSHQDWTLLDDAKKIADLTTVSSNNKAEVKLQSYSLTVRDGLQTEAESLLSESPVSVVLDTLADHKEAVPWVERGRHLHEGKDICIYCGGKLTDDRKRQIEQHFSDEVEHVQRQLDSLIRDVEGMQTSLTSLLGDGTLAGSLFDDLATTYKVEYELAKKQVAEFREWITGLLEALRKKRANVIGQVEYEITEAPAIDGSKLEQLVADHNERVAKYSELVKEAAKRVELHLLKEAEDRINELTADAEKKGKKKTELESTIKQHDEEVASLENVKGDPLPSAEVMSRELTRILGHNELGFELLPDGKHYRITRHGAPAHDLSTGERTAITLIHFLQNVREKSKAATSKPIVVIDDPVSSLDSNSAMGISTYIWGETVAKEHTEQVFLLTHNFELFRQWDIQIDGLPPGPNKRGPNNNKGYTSNCYELIAPHRKVGGIFKRVPAFIEWPPNAKTRLKVRSAYHHAFITAVRAHRAIAEDDSMETKLDALLLYPNVLRRMLETFLAFKNPITAGNFTGAMRSAGERLEALDYGGNADGLRHHLTRFTHEYSHAESPETDMVVNPDEIWAILASVFTFMSIIDKEHFEGLCAVVGVEPGDLILKAQAVVEAEDDGCEANDTLKARTEHA